MRGLALRHVFRLFDGLLGLGQDHLNVAGIRHVGIDLAALSTIFELLTQRRGSPDHGPDKYGDVASEPG